MAEFKRTRFELETKGISAKAGEAHTVTVLRGGGKRILVEDAHFHTDSSVFLPRDPGAGGGGIDAAKPFSNDAFWDAIKKVTPAYVETAKDGEFVPPEEAEEPAEPGGKGNAREAAGGLEVILAALSFLDQHPDHGLVVAGHTDRAGSEGHNQELSGARAECVAAVLQGDREGYVKAAKKHDTSESDGSMLAFAARARGFACDPADPAKPTAAEIKAFQKAYNDDFGKSISVDGTVGDQTRGAYFDLLEAELGLQAGGEDALASLRAKLKFVDDGKKTLACGERFPLERADEDGVASQANRRVELLFFGPGLQPDLAAKDAPDSVYHKGTFAFEEVDPETLEALAEDPEDPDATDELVLEDAPAPEDGAGEIDGDLESDMAKLQDELDPADQYAFLEPFAAAEPEFGSQSVGDFPQASGETVLV
jgi:hypothetical protein